MDCEGPFEKPEVEPSQTEKAHQNTKPQQKEALYPCKFCCRSYNNKQLLDIHMKNGHDFSKPYFCKQCPRRFKTERHLRGHKKAIHTPRHSIAHVCDVCSKQYTSRGTLRVHQKKMHEATNEKRKHYIREECGKVFKTSAGQSYHMQEHMAVDPFPCSRSQCKRGFHKKIDLKLHELAHRGVHSPFNVGTLDPPKNTKLFPCNLCDKSFAVHKNLVSHLEAHLENRSYNCEECGSAFRSECSLKAHLKGYHNHGRKYMTCDKFQKQFLEKQQLSTHRLEVHSVERILNSSQCPSSFNLESACPAAHRRKLKCNYCQKFFHSKWELVEHLETHVEDIKEKAETTTENSAEST